MENQNVRGNFINLSIPWEVFSRATSSWILATGCSDLRGIFLLILKALFVNIIWTFGFETAIIMFDLQSEDIHKRHLYELYSDCSVSWLYEKNILKDF